MKLVAQEVDSNKIHVLY